MQENDWYAPLQELRSLGSQKEKIANMGELAEARKKHLGQFFTPTDVARFMWRFVKRLPVSSILDNSIGSARLLQFCDPKFHKLFGVDVHAPTVDQVKQVVEAVGFECEIITSGMEFIQPRNFCVCIQNPPFSIPIQSPFLTPKPGFTRMGKFGPNTGTISDEYAVIQALEAAGIVVSLLPRSSADAIRNKLGCWDNEEVQLRLRGVFDLPQNSFEEEGAKVETSVVIFGERRRNIAFSHVQVSDLAAPQPDMGLLFAAEWRNKHRKGKPNLKHKLLECDEPTIILPVTGDNRVSISLDGRKIRMKYFCGLVHAKVANAVLRKRVASTEHTRLPDQVRYAGQGKLDLEVYLIQDDPLKAFEAFIAQIIEAGGNPILQPGVMNRLLKRITLQRRLSMPLRHTIWSRGASTADVVTGRAIKTHNVEPMVWRSPVVKKGTDISFRRLASGRFEYVHADRTFELNGDELEGRFTLLGVTEGWHVAHTGLLEAYPDLAAPLRKRLAKLGLDALLSWTFQADDAVELLLKPYGAIAAWKQACGKSRLAAALIMLAGVKHGLICLESRLINEMAGQLAKANVDPKLVNVIESPEGLANLRQINLISYERLRSPVDPKGPARNTYAKKLRRRIGLLVADEGERLANMGSDQSKALFQVSAKRRYILTGTPVNGWARDIHGLLLFVGGDSTAAQPYGFRRGYLEQNWYNSMEFARRGLDMVREHYVVTEWCTHEFADTLREGAKREIPKLANVNFYRSWLAPHIKRRLTEEPDVAKFIQLPKPTFETIEVDWDERHLAYYLRAAEDFSEWYNRRGEEEKKGNFAVLLAKLMAVQMALNAPQKGNEGLPGFLGMTSKQEAVVEYVTRVVRQGKKVLLYCESPTTVELLHDKLQVEGIPSVKFHGNISIAKRVADKDKYFINGNVPVMLATKGSARAGYNLPGADYVIFYDRSWSAKTESQAMHRPIRVERKLPVTVVYFHLPGSLDHYQSQMVAFKADSAAAGVDYATPEMEDVEFLHLSTILGQFVEDLAAMRGMLPADLRRQLKSSVANCTSFSSIST